jgi:hypothetical protein
MAGIQVTFDCADPAAMAEFWAAALDYVIQPPPPGFDSWPAFLTSRGVPESDWNKASAIIDPAGAGPRVFFQRVPEPKSAKNRVHLDVRVAPAAADAEEHWRAIEAACDRLAALGATAGHDHDELGSRWRVMTDPEGNEFCLT